MLGALWWLSGLVFLGWDSPPGGSSGFLPVSKDLLWLLGKLAVVVADPVDHGDHVGLGQASMVIQGQAEAPVERLDRVRGPLPGRVEFKEGKQVALAMQEALKEQLLFMTDLELAEVNVHVVGVVTEKTQNIIDPDDLFNDETPDLNGDQS